MNRRLGAVALGVTCVALGAASQKLYDVYRSLPPQIFDIQNGTRNGASAPLMKLVVANLSP